MNYLFLWIVFTCFYRVHFLLKELANPLQLLVLELLGRSFSHCPQQFNDLVGQFLLQTFVAVRRPLFVLGNNLKDTVEEVQELLIFV